MKIQIHRLALLAALLVATSIAGCAAETPEADTRGAALEEQIAVTGGLVSGVDAGDGLRAFHGIPFAAPPTGDRRWAPPAPVEPWEGVLEGSAPGAACPQPMGPPEGFYSEDPGPTSEDCLTLNVWTGAESTGEKRPVMVWIHGGALVNGAGSRYPGDLLGSKGVVLVTVNYRLGPFGFLAHPELSAESSNGVSGNQGLRDQVAALEWVRDNVASFGGDPGNVTIFGESAGSLSVSLMQATPMARGLFHRAIGQSGGSFQPMTFRDRATSYIGSAEDLGALFAEALAGEGGDETLAGMRSASTEQVIATFNSNPAFSNYDSLAIVDGEVIPREVAAIFADGEQADVPVMVGSNADEATTFRPYFEPQFGSGVEGLNGYAAATLGLSPIDLEGAYPASSDEEAWRSWVDLFSDALFAYPSRTWVRSMENLKSPAYLYWFTWEPPVEDTEIYKSFHAADIGYVFGNVDLFGAVPTQVDHDFSDAVSDIWVRFARTGDPNGGDLPQWDAYTRDNEAYFELGAQLSPGTELRTEQMDVIEAAWAARRGSGEAAGSTGGP